ncbi:hypothetical protein FDP41_005012 [Naegleria fowleri]|uniref:Conserved oligomeric Golgi complex subunit 7 n=1 Tax=Naegleria fowleri TaxID=5763 RepID=A0A6A5BQH3_NAEFO|nr:uncharacterized protein FDP41_005012 [Naegleria fowleri]KAF0975685.1 hypothetical protein FDP41_005012 [Naegleria fowleri]
MDISKFLADDFDPTNWINEMLSSSSLLGNTSSDQVISGGNTRPSTPPLTSLNVPSMTTDMSYQVNQIMLKLQVLFSDLGSYMEQEVKTSIQKIPNALFEIEKMQDQTINLFVAVTSLYKKIENIDSECYEGNKHFETLKQLVQLKMALSSILLTLEQSKSLTKSMQQLDLLFRDRASNVSLHPTHSGSTISLSPNNVSSSSGSGAKSPIVTAQSPNLNVFSGESSNMQDISMETLREMTNQICCVEEGVRTLEPYSEKVKTKSKPKLLQYKEKLIKSLIGGKFVAEMMETSEKRNIEVCRELIYLTLRIDNINGIFTIFELYYDKNYKEIIQQQTKQQQFFNQILYMLKQEDNVYRKLFQGFTSQDELRNQAKIKLVEYCFNHKNCSLVKTEDLQQLVMIQYKSTKLFAKQLEDLSKYPSIQKLLFEPFAVTQSSYLRNLEKEYLMKQVRPHLSMSDSFVECVDEALNALFVECENALDRCITFTYGIESQMFIRVINQVFEDFGVLISKTINTEMNKAVKAKKPTTIQTDISFTTKDRENVQNALKLYELLHDKENGVKKKLEDLEQKIKSKLLEALKEVVLSKNVDEYYSTGSAIPLFTMAFKSVDINLLQPSHNLAKSTLMAFVSSLITGSTKNLTGKSYYLSLIDPGNTVEYVDDIHLPELQHSIPPSKFVSQVGEYLIKLPEQLEILANDDFVAFWIDRICKETLNLLSSSVEAPKSGSKYQILQWNADVRYLRHVLVEVLDFNGPELNILTTIGK